MTKIEVEQVSCIGPEQDRARREKWHAEHLAGLAVQNGGQLSEVVHEWADAPNDAGNFRLVSRASVEVEDDARWRQAFGVK